MIVLGRIVAPYGIKGWLRVRAFGDDPAAWRNMPSWWLGATADGNAWTAHKVAGLREQGKDIVVKLDGCDDRTAAERLDGMFVAAPREALPAPDDETYYWADLVGLDVVNEGGEALGKIATLIETGANTVLVVHEGERERLLPFVAQVVKEVDVAGRKVRVAWEADW